LARAGVSGNLIGMLSSEQMDALVDAHDRAEKTGNISAIVEGFRIDRFEPVRRWHGESHVVDESILHGVAGGRVFGLDGRDRPMHVRLLHVFDFDGSAIARESAWLDVAGLQQQLAAPASDPSVPSPVDPRRLEALDVLGPTIQYITPLDADGDLPCVMRGTIPPGGVVPLHSHADPETFLSLSGEPEVCRLSADRFEWVPVDPGQALYVPPHARHAWRNRSSEPAVAVLVTTATMGRFFREIGTAADQTDTNGQPPSPAALQRFVEAAQRHGHWLATPEENARVGIDVVMATSTGA
jgi:quercetin dioxygenase-like cupin family protein